MIHYFVRNIPTRENICTQRIKTQNLNYEIIKKIKVHNENKEPISLNQLCTPNDHYKVAKILREAHGWGMIESLSGGHFEGMGYFQLIVTFVGDAFIEYCEKRKENGTTKKVS